MPSDAYVYFMANQRNTVLYIGVTNDLVRRVAEHKIGTLPGFTTRYNCTKLVYFEAGQGITAAIAREKQLKGWRRSWKDTLVNTANPDWHDLSSTIGVTPELLARLARDPGSSPG